MYILYRLLFYEKKDVCGHPFLFYAYGNCKNKHQ